MSDGGLSRHREGEEGYGLLGVDMHHYKCFEGFGKGLLAGLVAGAAASWVMEQFQVAWGRLADQAQSRGRASRQKQETKTDEQAPATLKTAEMISERLVHHELTESEKRRAGPVVHYAFGTMIGGMYGALAEALPGVTRAAGLPFGAAL